MRVRDARYYIDSPQQKFSMFPVDGTFDSQEEEIFAELNASNITPGKHVIYIEAMERNNKWGLPASTGFTVDGNMVMNDPKKISYGIFPLLGVLAAFLVKKRLSRNSNFIK